MMNTRAIDIVHLSHILPGDKRQVLNRIDLAVPTGAVVGLVGRNGAGKSTLMRCLVGLTVPSEGYSELLGCRSLQLDDATRERLGYVAQTPDLFEAMTVWQHIEFIGRAYQHWTEERALELATMLQLPMGGKASELSQGDQQKLSVLLALAHDPDLVLMDEPVSSLDPLARRDFLRALFAGREDASRPRTVLISSHLLSDLERVITHVAFVREGQVQLFDEWDALSEHLHVVDMKSDPSPHPGATAANPHPALLHRCADGRALLDARRAPMPAQARHLGLEDIFVLLNT